jgi:hypothetical protein
VEDLQQVPNIHATPTHFQGGKRCLERQKEVARPVEENQGRTRGGRGVMGIWQRLVVFIVMATIFIFDVLIVVWAFVS